MKSHNKQILAHLKKGNSITAWEALNLFQCFRLSARIYDLRDAGHKIDKITVRMGKKMFARYKLSQ